MRLPSAARALLAAAVLLLAAGTTYGIVGSEPEERADPWVNPRQGVVESGDCSRKLHLLPSRRPPPPDFIRYRERTYVRAGGEVRAPERLSDTKFRHRIWRLNRAGEDLYLETIEDGTLIRYSPGQCP